MSQADYVFHDDDRLTTHWRSTAGGELTEGTATIRLKRRK